MHRRRHRVSSSFKKRWATTYTIWSHDAQYMLQISWSPRKHFLWRAICERFTCAAPEWWRSLMPNSHRHLCCFCADRCCVGLWNAWNAVWSIDPRRKSKICCEPMWFVWWLMMIMTSTRKWVITDLVYVERHNLQSREDICIEVCDEHMGWRYYLMCILMCIWKREERDYIGNAVLLLGNWWN